MMAMQTPLQAAPKRPRLSLKINTCGGGPAFSGRPRGFPVDATDPTAFNTLSNAYVTAMAAVEQPSKDARLRVTTPFASAPYPETPVTAPPKQQQQQQQQQLDNVEYTSTMTPTPPLSAGDDNVAFSFSPKDVLSSSKPKPQPQPYTHHRSLHSILRNSPLPPRTAIPSSSRRQSSRLHDKAAKRVCYNNPLTQTITTNKYTLSHIDLLVEEASPAPDPLSCSPAEPESHVDLTQAFSANEIQDGGQTPGPFEDLRRRLAGLGPGTPLEPTAITAAAKSGGIRKRRRRDKEKKRQWVWTIGVGHDGDNDRC